MWLWQINCCQRYCCSNWFENLISLKAMLKFYHTFLWVRKWLKKVIFVHFILIHKPVVLLEGSGLLSTLYDTSCKKLKVAKCNFRNSKGDGINILKIKHLIKTWSHFTNLCNLWQGVTGITPAWEVPIINLWALIVTMFTLQYIGWCSSRVDHNFMYKKVFIF